MGSVGKSNNLNQLIVKAQNESNPNRVLNSVPKESMGSNFQSLSPADRATIGGLLSLRKADIEFLTSGNNYTVSNGVRIKGIKYNVVIGINENKTDVTYTLKQGNKFIVKNGSYMNVANQLAILVNKK